MSPRSRPKSERSLHLAASGAGMASSHPLPRCENPLPPVPCLWRSTPSSAQRRELEVAQAKDRPQVGRLNKRKFELCGEDDKVTTTKQEDNRREMRNGGWTVAVPWCQHTILTDTQGFWVGGRRCTSSSSRCLNLPPKAADRCFRWKTITWGLLVTVFRRRPDQEWNFIIVPSERFLTFFRKNFALKNLPLRS
jgi:hypothetical protein